MPLLFSGRHKIRHFILCVLWAATATSVAGGLSGRSRRQMCSKKWPARIQREDTRGCAVDPGAWAKMLREPPFLGAQLCVRRRNPLVALGMIVF